MTMMGWLNVVEKYFRKCSFFPSLTRKHKVVNFRRALVNTSSNLALGVCNVPSLLSNFAFSLFTPCVCVGIQWSPKNPLAHSYVSESSSLDLHTRECRSSPGVRAYLRRKQKGDFYLAVQEFYSQNAPGTNKMCSVKFLGIYSLCHFRDSPKTKRSPLVPKSWEKSDKV